MLIETRLCAVRFTPQVRAAVQLVWLPPCWGTPPPVDSSWRAEPWCWPTAESSASTSLTRYKGFASQTVCVRLIFVSPGLKTNVPFVVQMREDDRVAIHEAMEQQTISIAKVSAKSVKPDSLTVLNDSTEQKLNILTPPAGRHHHHPELPLLSAGRSQLCVWPLGRHKGGGQHRLHAHHFVPFWYDLHH